MSNNSIKTHRNSNDLPIFSDNYDKDYFFWSLQKNSVNDRKMTEKINPDLNK